MLKVESVAVRIGAVEALRGFSLEVATGAMVALSGRNGAGKTTVLRTIMGLARPRSGRVTLDGRDLADVAVHDRTRLGIGYMPEDRGLVPELTVAENILLPTWATPGLDGGERLALVWRIMPELEEMADRKALLLSGGQQKMAALGRALAAGTKLLLLDEPFEGVAPALRQRLAEVIGSLRAERLSVLISQSELAHADASFDAEYVIERGENLDPVLGRAAHG
jgi:branched-chain amino acid transport system ATP-binding protein